MTGRSGQREGGDGSGSPTPDQPSAAPVDRTLPAVGGEAGDFPDMLTVSPTHYLLGRELARGGMGRILLARDRRLGRVVAVKEILFSDPGAVRRFEREVRITARLQHPSIVNVHEAGVWPSGEAFYTMALVTGRSLDVVIDGARSLDERLALLPNVLAVADAMAFAHGERIIHRDLKPGNVLVGAFGETVVIDWGLAKDLADPSAAPEGAGDYLPASGSDAVMTSAGAVIGTPAYMPPEQAQGRAVDERADVYALGAILHHVLAGQPPYTGASAVEVLAAVTSGPPVPLAQCQPGLPPELLALVDRAMGRDPATRYPTARELAEDLRRFQTGQLVGAHRYSLGQLLRRWARRYRASLSVAAVAAAVLLVFGAVALRRVVRAEALADEQRLAAKESRDEAENLLSFMLVDLRKKLAPLGRLDVLDDVSKKAIAYYDRKGEALSDAELARREQARRNLGDVLLAQGHTADALREYRASLTVTQALLANDPTNADRQWAVSESHNKVGLGLIAADDTTAALAEFRASLTIAESLAEKNPSNAGRQMGLSFLHDKLGDVLLEQGDRARALAEFQEALAITERLAAKDPTRAVLQGDLSVAHGKIGDVLLAQGDRASALPHYRVSLAIDETLATKDPTNAGSQRNLAISHEQVGDAIQGAEAIEHYQEAVALSERLAVSDPTNMDWQRDLSVSYGKLGAELLARGDPVRALTNLRAALTIGLTLAAKDPTNGILQRDLVEKHQLIGDVFFAQRDGPAAVAEYREALEIVQRLQATVPEREEYPELAGSLADKLRQAAALGAK